MVNWVLAIVGIGLATTVFAPELLAFPHELTIGDTKIYSESPLPKTMPRILARSDALLRTSAIYGPGYGRRIFLTDGGWRWHVLALQNAGAFGLSHAASDAILINRSDPARDLVFNGARIAGARSLSGTIAHERTHGLIRARYGMVADVRYPAWLREGYCDVVAGGGSLSNADAAALKARHETVPALLYYDGRKRVAELLRANGGSVDALFKANPPLR
jgi:hypothetical protein